MLDDGGADPGAAAGDEYPLSARLGYCANRSLMIPFVVVGPSPIL
jgi:hypothetical protein